MNITAYAIKMIMKWLCLIMMYLVINVSSALGQSKEQTEELKTKYKNDLTEKNKLKAESINIVASKSCEEYMKELHGIEGGYSFESGEASIRDFRAKYYNKMVKVTGRVAKIDRDEQTITLQNSNKGTFSQIGTVKCFVDDPLIYEIGENAVIVGRSIGVDKWCCFYIDGSEIRQQKETLETTVPALVNTIQYDVVISARNILNDFNTFGNGNILFEKYHGKKILITGHILDTKRNYIQIIPTGNTYKPLKDSMIIVNYENADYYYNKGDEISIVCTYENANDLTRKVIFNSAD